MQPPKLPKPKRSVYANASNTKAVRDGLEKGGYLLYALYTQPQMFQYADDWARYSLEERKDTYKPEHEPRALSAAEMKDLIFSLAWYDASVYHRQNAKELLANAYPDSDFAWELGEFERCKTIPPGPGCPR